MVSVTIDSPNPGQCRGLELIWSAGPIAERFHESGRADGGPSSWTSPSIRVLLAWQAGRWRRAGWSASGRCSRASRCRSGRCRARGAALRLRLPVQPRGRSAPASMRWWRHSSRRSRPIRHCRKCVSLESLDAECPSYPAMRGNCWPGAGSSLLVLAETMRGLFATREFGVEAHRRRPARNCARTGSGWRCWARSKCVNERTPDGAEQAFESFLALEKASWKGDEGTGAAVRSAGMRLLSGGCSSSLAAQRNASVALLRVGGEAICGPGADVLRQPPAYTWKTAFDSELRQIFARRPADRPDHRRAPCAGPDIEAINSCAAETEFHGPAVGRTAGDGRHAAGHQPPAADRLV